MPLEETTRDLIHDYCVRDLPGDINWHTDRFSFINDDELRVRLGRAFYSARYTYKLMEATFVQGDEQHPFVKFQIMQYASIYEAVITNLLWGKFKEHPEVLQLQTHKSYKPVNALGSLTKMWFGEEELFTCVYRDSKTPKNSIPFKDKVDCAVRIGFVNGSYSEDIKRTYELRNLAHIETEANKQLDVEIEQSKHAYWRLGPFLDDVVTFLAGNGE
ncbi:hypothetical protein [Marinobacter salsuginis]|uniref:Uncharacterized protein n=1 Tax=Marinobacter salsuginis TaxID=418719 RepID=A0A5M3Q5H9_9GAMM|nr:hypothetical protein [Marinobacter salsuginis]GBO90528.1 hypothetical protein MSSD14B_41960 [Marinobacter salsuginis]